MEVLRRPTEGWTYFQWKSCVLSYTTMILCNCIMKFPTRLHYNCKCCTPTWVLILAVNGVQDIGICVNVVDNKKWLMNCTDILNNDK